MIYLSDDQKELLKDYLLLFPRTKINGKYVKMGEGVVKPDDVSMMWCGLVERVLRNGYYRQNDKRFLNGPVCKMVKANRKWIAQEKFNRLFSETI